MFVDRLCYNSHHYSESCSHTKLKKLPAGKVFHLSLYIGVGKLIACDGEDRWPYCLCGLCLFQQLGWSSPWQHSLVSCFIETPHSEYPTSQAENKAMWNHQVFCLLFDIHSFQRWIVSKVGF